MNSNKVWNKVGPKSGNVPQHGDAKGEWEDHDSDVAIDDWGVGIRASGSSFDDNEPGAAGVGDDWGGADWGEFDA